MVLLCDQVGWGFLLSISERFGVNGRADTLYEIGWAYGKCHNSIRAVLLPRGGIPPLARRRSRLALTFSEPEDTSRGMAAARRFVRSLVASIELRRQ